MDRKTCIFIAGDSTAAQKLPEKKPETGWGEKIVEFFSDKVLFQNFAVNGRSTKSFMDEGKLHKILETICKGDYLFIQFGHNDEKEAPERHTDPYTTYQSNLTEYIESARKLGATPILLTPIQRRSFDESGIIQETHGEYPAAMKETAEQLHVPLIDLCGSSKTFFEKLGPEQTKKVFLWVKPGESPNYPEGVQDNTHFCEHGATEIARLVIQGIKEAQLPLAKFIRE